MSGLHHAAEHHHAPSFARRAAIASVATALFLVGLKFYAAWQTGSVAMLGSLADTALDLVASVVTLATVVYAAMPADHDHRFGHGKAEGLAALFQVALIAVSALAIGWRAVVNLVSGTITSDAETGIGVSLIAMAVTFVLLAYQRAMMRRTGSIAIATDHLHYKSDLALNGAVIAALVLDQYADIGWADPVFGITIALWLLWSAWRGGSLAFDQLMDREWPDTRRDRLLEVAARHPAVRGIHDLRTRTSGSNDFAQFHIWINGDLTVSEAHRIMDEMEVMLAMDFPDVEFLIHPDPEGLVDEAALGAENLTAKR